MSRAKDAPEQDPTEVADDPTQGEHGQEAPPDDPAARAAYFENKFKESEAERRDLKRQTKGLKESVEEYKTGQNFWHDQAQKRALEANQNGNSNGSAAAAKAEKVEDALDDIPDLADLVTDEKGMEKLIGIVKRVSGMGRVSQKDIEAAAQRIADERIKATLDDMTSYGRVQEEFPELSNQTSEFAQAVATRLQDLQKNQDYKGLKPSALARMAATEIDREFMIAGKKRDTAEDARDRRIRAAGGAGSQARKSNEKSKGLSESDKKFAARAGLTDKEFLDEQESMELGRF